MVWWVLLLLWLSFIFETWMARREQKKMRVASVKTFTLTLEMVTMNTELIETNAAMNQRLATAIVQVEERVEKLENN